MREPGLLKPAVLWLLLLAPLFFSTYGFATWVTSQRSDVGTLVFGWETHMPFWAWTIVPYWSIDLLYGFSLLLPSTRHELKHHALRLLSAQVIAVSCFLIWPLRFTFERPELDGVFGWLFAVLAGFDKPFNQAPSLHIALLVILWVMLPTSYPRFLALAGAWLVRADRDFGADHLSTSLYRLTHRRPRRLAVRVVVAAGTSEPAAECTACPRSRSAGSWACATAWARWR